MSLQKRNNSTNKDPNIEYWFWIFMAGFIIGGVVGGTMVAYMLYGLLWELLYSCAWTQGYAFAWNISGVIP